MSPELAAAIGRTKALFLERTRSEDWSQNVVEGSAGIRTLQDWTKYYSFLSNPEEFDPEVDLPTINGDEVIEGPPPGLEVVEYRNGTDFTIHYKRIREDEKEEEKAEAVVRKEAVEREKLKQQQIAAGTRRSTRRRNPEKERLRKEREKRQEQELAQFFLEEEKDAEDGKGPPRRKNEREDENAAGKAEAAARRA